MLVDQLTINEAAGARTTLTALLVVVALAAVIVLPPLSYLLWLTQKWTTPHVGARTKIERPTKDQGVPK
jgi:cytochrome d ubiquinol oxidase subunit II